MQFNLTLLEGNEYVRFRGAEYNIDGVDYWLNNTVCQDELPAPTTPSTEFFACYVNDALNRQFNTYEWNFDPPTAGAMVQNTLSRDNCWYYSNDYQLILWAWPIN